MDQLPPQPPPPVPQLPEPIVAPPEKEVPWRAREAIAVALLAFVTAGFLILILIALVTPEGGHLAGDQKKLVQLGSALTLELAVASWVLLWVKLRHHVNLSVVGLGYRKGDLGAGVATGMTGWIVAYAAGGAAQLIVRVVTGHTPSQPEQLPSGLQGNGIVLAFITAGVAAPFAEELFFRGFLYQAFRRWRGVGQAIVLSAAVFAVTHVDPLLIVGIFPLGILLARLFERRRSLGATMTAHMTFNLISLILVFVFKVNS